MKKQFLMTVLCLLSGCQTFQSDDKCIPYVLMGDLDTKLQNNEPVVQIKTIRAKTCSTSHRQADMHFAMDTTTAKEFKGQEIPLFIALVNKNEDVIERQDLKVKADNVTEFSAKFILPENYNIPMADHRVMIGFPLTPCERDELQLYKKRHIENRLHMVEPEQVVLEKLQQMEKKKTN